MGKRGKRNRTKRKEHQAAVVADGCDDETDGKSSPPSQDLTVACAGDDSFVIPDPFKATDIIENDALAALRKPWSVLLKKSKRKSWTPTPIQLQTWSVLLNSSVDMVGIAPTGSGKTYAYGIPLLSQIGPQDRGLQGIILVPTRELALQAEKDLTRTKCAVTVVAVYGGVDRDAQLESLASVDTPIVVTATPGRLGDLLQHERLADKVSNNHLKWVVMDEADRLATQVDMSKQVDDILELLGESSNRRMCLFSATHPESASKWNSWLGKVHVVIKINTVTVGQKHIPENSPVQDGSKPAVQSETNEDNGDADEEERPKKRKPGPLDLARIPSNVTQTLHVCSAHKKPKKLLTTLQKVRPKKGSRQQSLCLIFFARIKTLQYMSKMLTKDGIHCAELHSHLNQRDREAVLSNFRCGKVQLLLATDVAARGIHVANVDAVINYDFPISLEQYVHRCGRAGRTNDRPAVVYSFFTRELRPMAKDVVALLRETNAWLDPNLIELAGDKAEGKRTKRRKVQQQQQQQHDQEQPAAAAPKKEAVSDDEDYTEESRQFNFLNPNRIMLKRASHVSEASSSEDEDD